MHLKSFLINKNSVKIIAGLFLGIAILSVSYLRLFETFELATLDLRFKMRPVQEISDDIVIIEIAEDTLNQVGTWPIDREYHALLIDALTKFNARSVLFDVIFTKRQNPLSDAALVEAAQRSKSTYLAKAFRLSKEKSGFPFAHYVESGPFPELSEVANGTGHINIINDMDGKRRRVPFFVRYKEKLYPYLPFLAACHYFNKTPDTVSIKPGYIQLNPKIKIPIDENGMTLINFAGRWEDTFRHYSFIDILKSDIQISNNETPRIDLNELKDKICIVGLTAVGTHDVHPIPLQKDYPGVGVHASVINSIINNSFIARAGKSVNCLILIILILITSILTLKLKPTKSLLAILGLLVLFTASAIGSFSFLGIWIDLFYPLLLISLAYLFSTFYKYISERNKRMIMEKELDIARSIQKSFLRETPPEKAGLDIAVRMDTAKAVGGDLYDFVELDDDRLGVMIGDVSGKGVPAALFMAKTVSEFRFHSKIQPLPSQAIAQLNDQISIESTSGLFVTVCYLSVDLNKKNIHIVDAGHLPVIAAHEDGPTEEIKVEGAMAIGIMDGVEYTQHPIPFKKGDVFVLYTDGVTEAWNSKKEEFGQERIKEVVSASKSRTAKEIVEDIFRNIRKFQGRAPQHDDITVMVIKIV